MREIEKRLADSSWDLKIAGQVISRRKRHNSRIFMSGSLLSMTVLVFSLVLFNLDRTSDPINQQIFGIYETQYTDTSSMTGEDTDTLLKEILAMR